MSDPSMAIVQISTRDTGGGADRMAMLLHQQYRQLGLEATLAVGEKLTDTPGVTAIDTTWPTNRWSGKLLAWSNQLQDTGPSGPTWRGAWRLGRTMRWLAQPRRTWRRHRGHDDFDHPGSRRLLADLPPHTIVHGHNLHGHDFDLRLLAKISHTHPTVLTLHDAWLLAGHCGHSLDCERWRTGCGACPYLQLPPAVTHDATAANWQGKADIFAASRLHVITPSQWLMDKARKSMLWPGVRHARVIPNGVDLGVFKPGDTAKARAKLGLPEDAVILLFAANGIRQSPWKDYQMLRRAVWEAANRLGDRKLLFVALGEAADDEQLGNARIHFEPYRDKADDVARFYQAADVYLHAARVDTFPNVVLEAMACGTPVIATDVGGIAEQIDHGDTGLLVPAGDHRGMARQIRMLVEDRAYRYRIGQAGAAKAARQFDLALQVKRYLEFYRQASSGDAVRRAA